MATSTITVHAAAPPEKVWEVLTHSDEWSRWTDFSTTVRETLGTGHPDGVGSVRAMWLGGVLKAQEEVLTFDPDAGVYEYKLLKGLPNIRDHRGRVELSADGDGTQIAWQYANKPTLPIPGLDAANGAFMNTIITRLASGLAKESARQNV